MVLEGLERVSNSVFYKKSSTEEENKLMSVIHFDRNSIFGLIDDSVIEEYKFSH